MNKFLEVKAFLEGKKTYIVAALLVLYALSGYFSGKLTLNEAELVVLNGLGLGALRGGLGK